MRGWLPAVVSLALALALAAPARAQRRRSADAPPAGVAFSITPERAPSGLVTSRYRYVFELRPTTWSAAEVIADRRLISFVVRPTGSRRRHTCRHPDAPRSPDDARLRALGERGETARGAPVYGAWREWIDLRMYCWGRALAALDAGARIEPTYGFTRARRGRWVARPTGNEAAAVRSLSAEPFDLGAMPAPPEPAAEPSHAPGAPPPPPVRVTLRRSDASTESGLSLRPSLRAAPGTTARIYVRDDLYRFRIDGPLGRVECGMARTPIVPIVDFYTRLSSRRRAGTSILARYACPGAFEIEGIYEVTPIVDLVYDGARYELETVTGTFEGEPTPIRIRHGDRGYVEQIPGETLDRRQGGST